MKYTACNKIWYSQSKRSLEYAPRKFINNCGEDRVKIGNKKVPKSPEVSITLLVVLG